MDHQTQDSQAGIETAGVYYNNWVGFIKFSTWGIVVAVVLLAVMAITLV